ncbi:MAG: hypothetical protein ABIK83_06635 [Candidatus Zixiibacteriota bacterium]
MPDGDLPSVLELQVHRLSPFSDKEVLWGYRTIPSPADKRLDVSLYILRIQPSMTLIGLAEEAGLVLDGIFASPDCLAFFTAQAAGSQERGQDEYAVIVDKGSDCFHIVIAEDRGVVYSRALDHSYVPRSDGQIALDGELVDVLSREIERTLEVAAERRSGMKCSRLVLSGEKKWVEAVKSRFIQTSGYPVSIVPTDDRCSTSEGEHVSSDTIAPTPMLGAIVSGAHTLPDLTPISVRDRIKAKAQMRHVIAATILMILGFLLLAALVDIRLRRQQEYLELLEQRISETAITAATIEDDWSKVRILQQQAGLGPNALDVLYELHQRVPASVKLDVFDYNRRHGVIIRGTGPNLGIVLSLVDAVKGSPIFDEVRLGFANIDKSKSSNSSRFQILLKLTGEEP